jgi:pSer/pThr/pTyr-binding forkhead associated (FHA) protein
MSAFLELWRASGVEPVVLGDDRVTVGAEDSNDVCLADDGTVSRLHAVVEHYGSGWAVRDLGSRNGTFINGRRVLGEQALHPGDELRIGKTRLIFRDHDAPMRAGRGTQVLDVDTAPELTRRERDVLHALCRPLGSAEPFSQPASIRAIAKELVVTDAAVKQHLLRLYDKFGLTDRSENRRVRLANEAIARGVITSGELSRLREAAGG